MRPFFYASCLIAVVALGFAEPLAAKGGKGGGGGGGGGGGHGRGNAGGGHGGGGPKWSGQPSHPGGGQQFAEHGQKPANAGKPQFADKQPQSGKDKEKEDDKHARSTSTTDPTNTATDAYNKKQKQLAIEQQNRDKRLAQAQHLREIGERNGNQNLIDNADRMEAFAHDHYARRVSQLEKFGVTDPLLNPGTSVTNPLLPGTGGLVDPVGDVGLLNLLPVRP